MVNPHLAWKCGCEQEQPCRYWGSRRTDEDIVWSLLYRLYASCYLSLNLKYYPYGWKKMLHSFDKEVRTRASSEESKLLSLGCRKIGCCRKKLTTFTSDEKVHNFSTQGLLLIFGRALAKKNMCAKKGENGEARAGKYGWAKVLCSVLRQMKLSLPS